MRRLGPPLVLAASLVALAAPADEPLRPVLPGGRQPVKKAPPAATQLNDAEALKQVNLSADEAKPLLDYIRARTLSDSELGTITQVIARFGADDYDTRERATDEVARFGPAAIGPLKAAANHADPEVAYRAKLALRRVEKVPHTLVLIAAARALGKLKPKEAAPVLLGFLPLADTEEVAEAIRGALVQLAVSDKGTPEPALVAALDDKQVARRAAACVALVEGTTADAAAHKEAVRLVTAAAGKEADPEARFQALWALLAATRDRAHLRGLVAAIPKLPRGRLWQLESVLTQLNGDPKPIAPMGKSEASLNKARDAWAEWVEKAGTRLDLAKVDFDKVGGFVDLVEVDGRGYGPVRVVTLGPDLKPKGAFGGVGIQQINSPADARRLPNGNYLIAEMNRSQVTERDATGQVSKTLNVQGPISAQPLPGGGMLVIGRNAVTQYDKDWKPEWSVNWQQFSIIGGTRLPGGDVVFVTNQPPQNCHRIRVRSTEKDGKKVWEAKEDGKPVALGAGRINQFQRIDAPTDDRLLVCEYNRVAEYDLKTGKEVWKHDGPTPTSCQRLPNGNTLIAFLNLGPNGKLVEVDPSNEVLWEYEGKDGMRPSRGFRR